jgi:hypothetical protein
MIRSAAILRRTVGLPFNQFSAIFSSDMVVPIFDYRSRNPNLLRRSAMIASVTRGRTVRYAKGSARGLL